MKAANWKFKVKSHCQWGGKLAVFNLCSLDESSSKLQDERRHIWSFFIYFLTVSFRVLITNKERKNKAAGLKEKMI